ncbi:MAG: VPLPA-CTERM sorting domain-containing protein [Pseudomonadota bacterium]
MNNIFVTAALLTGLATAGQAAVFNFDDAAFLDTTVNSVTTSDGSIAAKLTTQRGPVGSRVDGIAAIFNTENASNAPGGSAGDPDLVEEALSSAAFFKGQGFGGALIVSETLGPNDVGVALTPADDNFNGGSITFDFMDTLVNLKSFDILDDATVTVVAGGASSIFTVGTDGGFGSFDLTGLGFNAVSSVTFDFGSASGAIDNFRVTAVPVPAALPLLLVGLGGLGLLARRRKTS